MPNIDEILAEKQKKKKFVKKSYRPWDLTGEGTSTAIVEKNISEDTSTQKSNNSLLEAEIKPKNAKKLQGTSLTKKTPPHSVLNKQEKLENNIEHNIEHNIDYNEETKRLHIDYRKITDRIQTYDNQITHRSQLEYTLDPTSLKARVQRVTGLGQKILNLILDICLLKEQDTTGPIETSLLVGATESTYSSVKGTILRLVSKGFIIRNKGKSAKGGYVNLMLPEEVKVALLNQRSLVDQNQNVLGLLNSIRAQLDYKSPYISSSNITTTNLNKNNFQESSIPAEWQEIDITSLEHIGFGKTQLKQLMDKATPETIQESLNHFSYGLEHNPKVKAYNDPLNVLMGVLRKGQMWIEQGYRTTQEIAQEQLLMQLTESKKREDDLAKKAKELAFNLWLKDLDELQKEKILKQSPKEIIMAPERVKLSTHFKQKIWEDIKKDYLIQD